MRDLHRWYQTELKRRDEQIAQLLDRLQHPDRVPIWREPPGAHDYEPPRPADDYVYDADQVAT